MQGACGFRNGTNGGIVASALRWYEKTRRRKVTAVSRVASLQVSHGESVLKPAAMIPDRFMTWALTMFLAFGESPPDIRGDQPTTSRPRRPLHDVTIPGDGYE